MKRLSAAPLLALPVAAQGTLFQEDTDQSPVFRTWRAGIDYVLYQEPWVHHGPYVFAGIGLQYSKVDYLVQSVTSQALSGHRSSISALWVGARFGCQITPDTALELRYSAADYTGERGQALGSFTATEPVRRNGQFLHVILAVRAPF